MNRNKREEMNPDPTIKCEYIARGEAPVHTPGAVQKVVHLIRHGQGTHNVFAMAKHREGSTCLCLKNLPGCPYVNEAHTDARLTELGRMQAAAAGAAILQTAPLPEVVLVSPLWRTLETATIALQRSSLGVPVVAEETIRERNGVHFCDMRSPAEKAQAHFTAVDFGRIIPGPDPLFSTTIRETDHQVAARGRAFFLSLRNRPENSFAVFSHSSFLYNTINKGFDTADPQRMSASLFELLSPQSGIANHIVSQLPSGLKQLAAMMLAFVITEA